MIKLDFKEESFLIREWWDLLPLKLIILLSQVRWCIKPLINTLKLEFTISNSMQLNSNPISTCLNLPTILMPKWEIHSPTPSSFHNFIQHPLTRIWWLKPCNTNSSKTSLSITTRINWINYMVVKMPPLEETLRTKIND
jgi:hypothetical protein